MHSRRAASENAEMDRQQRLRIAVQKSGRLTDESLDLLHRCGLKFSRGKDQLMCYGENMPLDVLFVRDDDIPDLVQEDVCDLGLVGLNVLEEKRLAMVARGTPPAIEVLQKLDFGRCRLALAVPDEFTYAGLESISGKRIATTYPYVLARFLQEHSIEAQVVTLSGAVEIAPRLGRADLICDLVTTATSRR
jgi:ATP phosphoribosyltransferase